MRNWINLCENHTYEEFDEFYHASRDTLPEDTVLRNTGTGMDEELEEILAPHRPAHAHDRTKCVYVVDDLRVLDTVVSYYNHIYIVEPQGELQRYDAIWLDRIWQALTALNNGMDFTDDEKARLASGYWSGQPCPRDHGEEVSWEYLCPSAVVIEEIEE